MAATQSRPISFAVLVGGANSLPVAWRRARVEGRFGDAVKEVRGPAAQHHVAVMRHGLERPVVGSLGQLFAPRPSQPQSFFARIGVDRMLARASLLVPLDAEAERWRCGQIPPTLKGGQLLMTSSRDVSAARSGRWCGETPNRRAHGDPPAATRKTDERRSSRRQ
jgi:hypothetical protein